MSYKDFTLTSFGQAWMAQAAADVINGTNNAVLTSVNYGEADSNDPPSLSVLWFSDSSPFITNYNDTLNIRSHADNSSLTTTRDFDYIEIMGKVTGNSGPEDVIAYCKSDTVETIPAFQDYPVTKYCTIQLVVGAASTITLSATAIPATVLTSDLPNLCMCFDSPLTSAQSTINNYLTVVSMKKNLDNTYDIFQDNVYKYTASTPSTSAIDSYINVPQGMLLGVVQNGSTQYIRLSLSWSSLRTSFGSSPLSEADYYYVIGFRV